MVQWLSSCFEFVLLNPVTTYWDQDLTAGNRAFRFTLDTNASGFFIRIVEKFENGHSIIFVPEDCCRHGFRLFLAFLNKASYLLLNNKGNLNLATQKVGDATKDHSEAVPNEQTLMSGIPKLNVEARNSKAGPRALTNLENNDTIVTSQKATLEKSHVGDMGSNEGGSSGSFNVAQKDCDADNSSVAVIGSEDTFQTTTVRNSPIEGIGLALAVSSSVSFGTGVFHAITGSICKGKNDKETFSLNKDDNEGCVVNKLIESSSQASRSSTIDKLSIHASPFYPRNPLPNNLSLKDMKALNLKAEDIGKDSMMTSSSSKSPVGMLGTRVGDSDSYHTLEEEQQMLFGDRVSEEVDLVESEQIHEDIFFQIVEDFDHKGNELFSHSTSIPLGKVEGFYKGIPSASFTYEEEGILAENFKFAVIGRSSQELNLQELKAFLLKGGFNGGFKIRRVSAKTILFIFTQEADYVRFLRKQNCINIWNFFANLLQGPRARRGITLRQHFLEWGLRANSKTQRGNLRMVIPGIIAWNIWKIYTAAIYNEDSPAMSTTLKGIKTTIQQWNWLHRKKSWMIRDQELYDLGFEIFSLSGKYLHVEKIGIHSRHSIRRRGVNDDFTEGISP
ncbi:unnamed protein product [Cuscuta campestris]|uniref:DUF4283 domain-containing protein n=1 Tax=Cuscuta campestris TaxID=132261 RepID=A0A484LJ10_9ASTE|nr:unnamed protein product [Cuscuta campestris]